MNTERKLKILYVTTMYPTPAYPQNGIFCHEQVKALKKIGIDVTVAVPTPFYGRTKEKEWDYEGVHITYVRFFKLPHALDFHRTGRALFRSLEATFDLTQFDIYHADAPLPSGYAVMMASQKYQIPFIVHGHGLDAFLEGSYKDAANCKKIVDACIKVYQEADAIAGVSQKVLDEISKKVVLGDKAYVVYNGVDTERFHPVGRKTTDTLQIASIGNLIPLKGHDYTIRAIRLLVDAGISDIKLTIAGRGVLEAELKALTHELNLEEYVEFAGYIPYDDIVKLLQKSDLFVLPSWYEALGCVYLEAMACGVPAIGCYGNGIDEVIKDGVNGYLVEGKSEQQIYERIKAFIKSASQSEMRKNARSSVENRYTWMCSAEMLKQLYGDVINDTIEDE